MACHDKASIHHEEFSLDLNIDIFDILEVLGFLLAHGSVSLWVVFQMFVGIDDLLVFFSVIVVLVGVVLEGKFFEGRVDFLFTGV